MPIVEPVGYEEEELVTINHDPGNTCVAVSGYASFFRTFQTPSGRPMPPLETHNELVGEKEDDDDTQWIKYTVHLVVGPKWSSVKDVSPIVTVAGFAFTDNDSADHSGVHTDSCTWDTVGDSEPTPDLERIRLKVALRMCGGNGYNVTKLAYHLVATGRAMMER